MEIKNEQKIKNWSFEFARAMPTFARLHRKLEKSQAVRYIESGATAAGTNFVILWILAEYLKIWYLFSATIAFSIAVIVSFLFQKFWTFKDEESARGAVAAQGAIYLAISLLNVVLNALMVYFFVEKIGIWYILAQAIASLIIALWSFAAYRFLVFCRF